MAESKLEAVDLSEPLDGQLMSKYKELAKKLKVWLSLGGIHEKVGTVLSFYPKTYTGKNKPVLYIINILVKFNDLCFTTQSSTALR